MKIIIGEKEIDLSKAFPMTIGDWVFMEEQGIIDDEGSFNEGARSTLKMLTRFVSKIDSEMTEERVGTIPMGELNDIATYIGKQLSSEQPPINPTGSSTQPILSEKPMDGPSRTSELSG